MAKYSGECLAKLIRFQSRIRSSSIIYDSKKHANILIIATKKCPMAGALAIMNFKSPLRSVRGGGGGGSGTDIDS